METLNENLPDAPKRVIAFVGFFKRYMSLSSVIAAALPIPITAFKLIPVFSVHMQLLSVLTPLFCFLTLGFIFYVRHAIAGFMFNPPKGRIVEARLLTLLPLFLILSSFISFGLYYEGLNYSIADLIKNGTHLSAIDILERTEMQNIPGGALLVVAYISAFVLAEASFVLMAVKEYLQDVLGISEIEAIRNWATG